MSDEQAKMKTISAATSTELKIVSLIVPVYNEADHLLEFLQALDALILPLEKELIIVNDCSTDSSVQIINDFPFQSKMIFIDKPTNEGKGAALRTGIEKASGDIIGVQDADFEYDIEDIAKVLEPILKGKADVVFGSRYKNSQTVHRTLHYLINRTLTMASNICSGLYLSDMETCYKFFRADILQNIKLQSNRFGFEPEITAKISRLKIKIAEVPIHYNPRNYIEGKKITWKDGIAAFGHIIRFNFLTNWDESFTKDLPKKYSPGKHHWL